MRIAGNLDVEVTWSRIDAAARRARGEKAPSPDDPRLALPEPVMRKISAAATLLRVFAASEDVELWTPRPVDPSRMPEIGWWMPKVRLTSGPVPEAADLWWGVPTEVAARVNHRLFAWDARVRCRQPRLRGGTVVHDVDGLREAASEMLGDRGPEPWVAKAPFSAAGRLRVRGAGELEDKQRFQAERLLELQGVLLFEPWVRRVADFGVDGYSWGTHATVGSIHALAVDGSGRFVAVRDRAPALTPHEALSVGAAAAQMGNALAEAGYEGRFTVDGFVYEDGESRHVQCVSEINARTTFGDVAARIAEMACETIPRAAEAESVTLLFGRGAPPPDTISLLLPGTDDDTSAWLEVTERHGS